MRITELRVELVWENGRLQRNDAPHTDGVCVQCGQGCRILAAGLRDGDQVGAVGAPCALVGLSALVVWLDDYLPLPPLLQVASIQFN